MAYNLPQLDGNSDDQESSHIDLPVQENLLKGLDFLATIACGISGDDRIQNFSHHDKNFNREDKTLEQNDSETKESEGIELDNLIKFDTTVALGTFLPFSSSSGHHAWITEPPPGASKEFLDDNIINTRDKRIFLARHTAYCDKVKNDEVKSQLHKMDNARAFERLQTKQLLQIQRNKENKQKNKRTKIDDDKDQLSHQTNDDEMIDNVMTAMKDVPLFYLHEPEVLRMTIYEKFVRQYLYYHNKHDTQAMMTTTLLPYCSKDIVRQNCLWGIRSIVDPMNGQSQPGVVVVENTTYAGLASFPMTFNMLFQKLPDCVIAYQQSRIRHDIKKKTTRIYTPFSIFCTVQVRDEDLLCHENKDKPNKTHSLLKPVYDEETIAIKYKQLLHPRLHRIELEATGWNIVEFNEKNQVILRVDNLFIKNMIVDTPLDPNITGEAVWRAVWKR